MFDLRNRSHFKTKKERNIPFYICFQEHCCFTHDASIRENSIFACVLFGYEGQVRKRHRFIMDITWKERLTRFEPIGVGRRGKRWRQDQHPREDFSTIWSKHVSLRRTRSPLASPCTSSLRRRSCAPAAVSLNLDLEPPPPRLRYLSPVLAVAAAAVSLDTPSFLLSKVIEPESITQSLFANPFLIPLCNVPNATKN